MFNIKYLLHHYTVQNHAEFTSQVCRQQNLLLASVTEVLKRKRRLVQHTLVYSDPRREIELGHELPHAKGVIIPLSKTKTFTHHTISNR